jgi:peptidoglycan/LPS O-acetylase OafA/YrhL
MTTSAEKFGYIDAVRGYAILMVILVHTSQAISGLSVPARWMTQYGQMGVQLFFVASALTLCLSQSRKLLSPSEFYLRRFFRIAPLYYVGIFFYFSLYVIRHFLKTGSFDEGPYTLANIVANILFINNYYKPSNNSVVPGGWSISMEMSFYLIFPVIFRLISSLRNRTKRQNVFVSVSLAITFFMIAVGFVLQAWVAELTNKQIVNNGQFYFSPLTQFPVFMFGIILFYVMSNNYNPDRRVCLAVFLSLTVVAILLLNSELGFAVLLAPSVAALSFSFFITLVRDTPSLRCTILRNVGQLSYSIYLFHFFFAWHISGLLYRTIVSQYVTGELALLIMFVIVTAGSYGIAMISGPLIEERGIRQGNRLANRYRSFLSKSSGATC